MSNIKSQQVLIPIQVFIGDIAELRCSFNSNNLSIKNFVNGDTVELSLSDFLKPLDLNEYEILKIQIFQSGVDFYQLSVNFKAWKTGKIQFPPLKIGEETFEFLPINIASLTEQNKISEIKENEGPLLLPYTTYKILGIVIVFLLFSILCFRLAIKRKKIIFFIKNQNLKRKYKKNKKQTLKQLRKILQTKMSDVDFSENFQHIMRNYLQQKFDAPFTNCVTSQMQKFFFNITQGLLSEQKNENFSELVSLFIRTDFVRYSKNASFYKEEKESIIKNTEKIIEILEKESFDEKKENFSVNCTKNAVLKEIEKNDFCKITSEELR